MSTQDIIDIFAICVPLINLVFNWRLASRQKRMERLTSLEAEARRKGNRRQKAIYALCLANAKALRELGANGPITAALEEIADFERVAALDDLTD